MQSMIYKGKVKTKPSERTNEPSRRHESATCELATTSLHGGIFFASNNRFPKQSVFCCNNLGCKKEKQPTTATPTDNCCLHFHMAVATGSQVDPGHFRWFITETIMWIQLNEVANEHSQFSSSSSSSSSCCCRGPLNGPMREMAPYVYVWVGLKLESIGNQPTAES